MTMETEEGTDFVKEFHAKFAAPERTKARRAAERRAGLTPKQRARHKGPPKKQVNFRATAQTKSLIDAIAEKTEQSAADVIALAVEKLAKQLKIGSAK